MSSAVINVIFAFATSTTPPGLADKTQDAVAKVAGAPVTVTEVKKGEYKIDLSAALSKAQLGQAGTDLAALTGCRLRGVSDAKVGNERDGNGRVVTQMLPPKILLACGG